MFIKINVYEFNYSTEQIRVIDSYVDADVCKQHIYI